jgi:membrane-associated phospholipid phosphatase
MKTWKWRQTASVVCLVSFLGAQARAAEAADGGPAAEPNGFGKALQSFRTDAAGFPDSFLSYSKEVFWNYPNLAALGVAGIASGIVDNNWDDKVAEDFRTRGKMSKSLDEALYIAGGPPTHFALTGLWYGLAAGSGDELSKERAFIMMNALAITGAATMSLKWAANNDCPNGAEYGWPSGHTSSTMCVASVLDEFYGPAVGIPAYVFTGVVGYRMMESGDHWASDVLFGAVLGWVVGHSVAGKSGRMQVAGCEIVPVNVAGGTGIGLLKKF